MNMKVNTSRLGDAEITHRAEVPVRLNFEKVVGMAKISKEDGVYTAEMKLSEDIIKNLTNPSLYSLACSGKVTEYKGEVISKFDIRGVSIIPEIFNEKKQQ